MNSFEKSLPSRNKRSNSLFMLLNKNSDAPYPAGPRAEALHFCPETSTSRTLLVK